MMLRPSTRGRAHVVAAVAMLLLVAGLGAWWWSARSPRPVRLPPLATPDTTSDRAVDQALDLAGRDSSVIKSRWHDEVAGFDLSGLDARRQELFVRFANAERCTCGCGYTLAGCRASDMNCEVSGPRLGALLDSVRSGRIRSASGLRARPDRGG